VTVKVTGVEDDGSSATVINVVSTEVGDGRVTVDEDEFSVKTVDDETEEEVACEYAGTEGTTEDEAVLLEVEILTLVLSVSVDTDTKESAMVLVLVLRVEDGAAEMVLVV